MWDLIFENGIAAVSWYAEFALRRRVSMSAIGSFFVWAGGPPPPCFPGARRGGRWARAARPGGRSGVLAPGCYQLDLVMPGSSPRCAMERKQIRQRPNFRYTARGRPQREQRVYPRTANFGFRLALTTSAVFAMSALPEGETEAPQQ